SKMLDAIVAGTAMLEARPSNNRRIMIVLGQSRDHGSKAKLDAAVERIGRSGVIVYPATYSAYATPWTAKPEDNPPTGGNLITGLGDLFRLGKANTAEVLAQATGGRHLSFETLKGLETAMTKAGDEIHGQYLLSFAPGASENNGFHRVVVGV